MLQSPPAPKEKKLVIWFTSDFGGCGHLRSIWINETLNSFYGSKKLYEGLCSSRFIVDKNILSQAKVFHFQRQITPSQLDYMKFIRKFRDENCKDGIIMYDCDDRFTDIPNFNYAHKFFVSPTLVPSIKTILETVDIVTVSTEEMADWIKSFNGPCLVKVVPNYLPKYVYRPYDFPKPKNNKPHIAWAGSMNHFSDDDMGDFKVIYDLILNTQEEFNWTLFGLRKLPKWISHLNKIKIVGWSPIVGFPSILKQHNIDFGLAPLIPHIFNEAKSNIKLLDYGSCDIIPICSNMKPYKESNLYFKNDWKEDRDQILEIFNSEEKTKTLISQGRNLCNKYWLESNSNKYMNLFNLSTIDPRERKMLGGI